MYLFFHKGFHSSGADLRELSPLMSLGKLGGEISIRKTGGEKGGGGRRGEGEKRRRRRGTERKREGGSVVLHFGGT